MGKSQPQPPPAPDPNVVSAAQTKSNVATALDQSQLNNGNSSGPYGTVSNVYNPATNQWSQTTALSPAEQAIFNQGTQAQGAALGIANTQLGRVDTALGQTLTAPGMQTGIAGAGALANQYGSGGPITNGFNPGQAVQGHVGPQNFNQAVNNTVNSSYNSQMALLNPQMQQASEQHQAQLVAQGLNPNDAAYQNSQTLFNNGQAQQRAQVAANAVGLGNQEQNTLFGQDVSQGQFANQAGAQQYAQNQGQAAFTNAAQAQANSQNQAQAGFQNTAQEQAFGQNQAQQQAYNAAQQSNFTNQAYAQQLPINEFSALMSQNQVSAPQTAQVAPTSVAPTDVLGAYALQSQAQQAQYQAQMANYQSGLGGLFGLGSAALSFLKPGISDIRAKRDIEPIGETLAGFPLYRFRYHWDDTERVGVMAQEVMRSRPDAVVLDPSGYLAVDYEAL